MQINPRSKAFRAATKTADFYAVCLVGWAKPRPMEFGDNEGIWPVKIVIRKKESEAAKELDSETPHIDGVVFEHVLVETMRRAVMLKDALHEVLLGHQEQQENRPLRKSFRNVVGCWQEQDEIGRGLFWSVLLQDALRILRKSSTSFEIFDDDEAHRRINRKATRGH